MDAVDAPDPDRLLRDLERALAGLTALCAAYAPDAADTARPARVPIPGTALTIIPPPAFAPAERFRGFEHATQPWSTIMAVPTPAPYAEATAGFDEGPLADAGLELLGRDPIRVSEVRGLRLDLAQEALGMRFRKTVLAFGDRAGTTLVTATWLTSDGPDDPYGPDLGPAMAASLASLQLDPDLAADPRGALDFTVDETAGDLRVAAVPGTSILLNRHGRIDPEAADQTAVLIDRSHSAPLIEDRELFVELRMRQLPGNWHLAPGTQVASVTYGGLDGYQVSAVDEASERDDAATIAVVYEPEGGYYVLVGMYRRGDEAGRRDAEAVMGTFAVR